MLTCRPPTILPALTLPEAIVTTHLQRVASLTGDRTAFVTTRPCRAPHHTISDVGLVGGGPGADARRRVTGAPWHAVFG